MTAGHPPAPKPSSEAPAAPGGALTAFQNAQALAAQRAQQWRGRRAFTVLALHWNQGLDWLATWTAWRADPERCHTLVWVVVSHELAVDAPQAPWALGDDVAASSPGWAHRIAPLWAQLQAVWPPATPDLHALHFEGGRVQLHLAPGAAGAWWAQLRLQADALSLPADPPADWAGLTAAKALARQTAAGASLHAEATWSAPEGSALQAVGFEPAPTPPECGGHFATYRPPAWRRAQALAAPPVHAAVQGAAHQAPRHAVVLGAGLAGAATAHALAQQGWQVQVVDRLPGPAQATSGNPGGLFHGTAHGDDGVHARLLRAAALMAWRELAPRIAAGLPGQADGLLRLDAVGEPRAGAATDASTPNGRPWPERWLQTMDRDLASARAGLALPAAGTWFPGGGWVSPADLVKAWLQHPAIQFLGGLDVQQLAYVATQDGKDGPPNDDGAAPAGQWQLLGGDGQVLVQAPVLVLAGAAGVAPLLAHPRATAGVLEPHAGQAWPLGLQRGQVSLWSGAATPLRHPVAGGGGGYALPLPSGLLFGATTQRGDPDPQVRDSDHAHNLQRLQQLTGLQPPRGAVLSGRVGWRLVSEDRLPLAGPVPSGQAPRFATQARAWPRAPGLFVCTGFGGRGLTLAPLMGQLVAAQIAGLPVPLPQRLVEAVDPARWLLKQARRGEGHTG